MSPREGHFEVVNCLEGLPFSAFSTEYGSPLLENNVASPELLILGLVFYSESLVTY